MTGTPKPGPPLKSDPDASGDWHDVAKMRVRINGLEQKMRARILVVCPTHRPVQNRDMKAPWCPACGRDARGRRIRDDT